MPRKILGTETLNGGNGVLEPTGTDRGEAFVKILVDYMRQYATHTHNGSDSLSATLPQGSTAVSTDAPTSSTDALGRTFYAYSVTVPNTDINTSRPVQLYYKIDTDADVIDNWKQLHCDYYLTEVQVGDKPLKVNITGLTKGNYHIKAIL